MGKKIVSIRRKEFRDRVFNRKLGQRLRELRYEHKYKLQDVEDMTGIRYDLISQIENGWARMTVMEMLAFCVIYETTLEQLFEGLWEHLEIPD